MEEQISECPYHGVLPTSKSSGPPAPANGAESQRHCAEQKKLDTQAFTLNPIYVIFSEKKT